MKPRNERIETLRRIEKSAIDDLSNKNFYTIKRWRGEKLIKKIVRVDSEYLMFRIENSRTEIQQLTYLRNNSLPDDFFTDPESPNVQLAQEEILIKMVRSKGKEFLEDLSIRKQDDACIITYDGYIVNGNRRTAGLKSLEERYVDCVLLPEDASPKDIYLLEQELQISQEFKEPYHWINELRNIRKGMEDKRLELSDKELAINLRLELKEVRVLLRTLDLIDAFLIWKSILGQYDYPKLDDAEEIFRQLEKNKRKYAKDLNKQTALHNAVFNLIEVRPTEGRLYGHVTKLIKNFDQVYAEMQAKAGAKEESSSHPSEGSSPDEANDISEVRENGDGTDGEVDESGGGLMNDLADDGDVSGADIFGNPEEASDTSGELMETLEDVDAKNKEKRNSEAVYQSVSSALRSIQGLSIDDETIKLSSIKNKLAQLIKASNRLLEELKDYED